MRIGELSRATGVKSKVLRHLINKGLIVARRLPGGNHRVPVADLPKIIDRLKEFGLIEQPLEK